MKDINVVLKAPVTEYCRSCDYKSFKSFYSYSAKCHKCGSSSIGHGPKYEPVATVYSSKGVYSIRLDGQRADEQYLYNFCIPGDKSYSIISDDEFDADCPIDLLEQLENNQTSMSSSGRQVLQVLRKILTDEYIESYYEAITRNTKLRLEYELYKILYRESM